MTERFKALDGLRGLAALLVVWSHTISWIWEMPGDMPAYLQPFLTWMYAGHYAVTIFILLSGCCLMLPLVKHNGNFKEGFRHWMERRAWRILPPYYMALIVSLFALWYRFGSKWIAAISTDSTEVVSFVLAKLTMTQDVIGRMSINGAFWSLAVEWKLYLLFPIMLLCWRKFGPIKASAILLVSGIIIAAVCNSTPLHGMTLHYISVYALGMLAASVMAGDKRLVWVSRVPWRWTLAVGAALSIAIVYECFRGIITTYWPADIIVGLTGLCALLHVHTRQESLLAKLLKCRPIVWLGEISYSLYLIHSPMLGMLLTYFDKKYSTQVLGWGVERFALYFITGTALSIFASWLFYLGVERTSMAWRDRVGKSKESATRSEAQIPVTG